VTGQLLPPDVPPMVEAWIRQLLDPEQLAVFKAAAPGRIDVRLSASRGKVSRQPVITLNAGPQEMIEIS
jgi:hypothetical protein